MTHNPSLAATKRHIRRETSYLILFAAMGLFAFTLALAAGWMLLGPSTASANIINAGQTDQFPPNDAPYPIRLEPANISSGHHQHNTGLPLVWLVNLDGELFAFHPFATKPGKCEFVWNEANEQFEDLVMVLSFG